LMTVFPRQGLSALPYAKSVSISAPNLGADFEGVVLEMPDSPKTLYVDGKSAESVSLRERYVERPYSLVTYSLLCLALLPSLILLMKDWNALCSSLSWNVHL